MQRPPPGIDQSTPSLVRYIQCIIRCCGVYHAIFCSFFFGYLRDVGGVSRGVFTEEDLTAALVDFTEGGGGGCV